MPKRRLSFRKFIRPTCVTPPLSIFARIIAAVRHCGRGGILPKTMPCGTIRLMTPSHSTVVRWRARLVARRPRFAVGAAHGKAHYRPVGRNGKFGRKGLAHECLADF